MKNLSASVVVDVKKNIGKLIDACVTQNAISGGKLVKRIYTPLYMYRINNMHFI